MSKTLNLFGFCVCLSTSWSLIQVDGCRHRGSTQRPSGSKRDSWIDPTTTSELSTNPNTPCPYRFQIILEPEESTRAKNETRFRMEPFKLAQPHECRFDRGVNGSKQPDGQLGIPKSWFNKRSPFGAVTKNGRPVCGATQVGSNTVVTAAHCILDNFAHDNSAILELRLGNKSIQEVDTICFDREYCSFQAHVRKRSLPTLRPVRSDIAIMRLKKPRKRVMACMHLDEPALASDTPLIVPLIVNTSEAVSDDQCSPDFRQLTYDHDYRWISRIHEECADPVQQMAPEMDCYEAQMGEKRLNEKRVFTRFDRGNGLMHWTPDGIRLVAVLGREPPSWRESKYDYFTDIHKSRDSIKRMLHGNGCIDVNQLWKEKNKFCEL